MKNLTLIILLAITNILCGQTQEEKIKSIKEKVEKINQDSSYNIKILRNEDFLDQMTDGGAELKGYRKNGKTYKIVESVGLSYCVRNFEYYLSDEKLIFVYENEQDFPYIDSIARLDYTRLELNFEGRYYFDNEKFIDKKISGLKRFSDATIQANEEKEFLLRVKRYFELFSHK